MSPQYGELRPTSGWDRFVSLGHPSKFQRVWSLGSVTARHSRSGRQPNSAALNRGRPLKLAGMPQTTGSVSAASGPKYTILWTHLEEILLLDKFFPIVDTCLSCEDIAWQSCATVPRWRFLATFLRPVFSASRVRHVSDLHPKFALRPHYHYVWKYGRHPICDG